MSEPFLGQIQLFGFNFAPIGWAKCDGELLPIAQHSALFSLLGTTYGGNGKTNFGLPDLRGRAPIHQGTGAGLSSRSMGQIGGAEDHTLNVNQIPNHSHTAQLRAATSNASTTAPSNMTSLATAREDTYHEEAASVNMRAGSVEIGSTGGGQSVDHMPPFLTMNWCIALIGLYPSRN